MQAGCVLQFGDLQSIELIADSNQGNLNVVVVLVGSSETPVKRGIKWEVLDALF